MKSSDGGDTWAASNAGLTDRRIASLAVDPRDAQIVYASVHTGAVGLPWWSLPDAAKLLGVGTLLFGLAAMVRKTP